MADIFDTLLLLALPASGKSEIRRFLESGSVEDFHMGETVQLDDFPYVHFMMLMDAAMEAEGLPRPYQPVFGNPFSDHLAWATLIELINMDFRDLKAKPAMPQEGAGLFMMERMDQARVAVGGEARLTVIDKKKLQRIAAEVEDEAGQMLKAKVANYPDTLAGKTLVIEFARGGPEGAAMPLGEGRGYINSLPRLDAEILQRAAALYVWVTPEESRRKNNERADPNDPGSILNHGVPMGVMLGEYGCDDMDYLIQLSDKAGTLAVKAQGQTFHIPIAKFDNRVDLTTFVRKPQAQWKAEEKEAIHKGLKEACSHLFSLYRG